MNQIYLSFFKNIIYNIEIKASFERLIFIKPGPAISIFLKSFIFFSNKFLYLIASLLGSNLFNFAKIIQILLDKSESKFDGGISKLTPLKLLISFKI